jgi:hypothetical protein
MGVIILEVAVQSSLQVSQFRAIAKYNLEIFACDRQSATLSPALPLGEGKGARRVGRGDFWIIKSSIS